jgi:hypothetical protein
MSGLLERIGRRRTPSSDRPDLLSEGSKESRPADPPAETGSSDAGNEAAANGAVGTHEPATATLAPPSNDNGATHEMPAAAHPTAEPAQHTAPAAAHPTAEPAEHTSAAAGDTADATTGATPVETPSFRDRGRLRRRARYLRRLRELQMRDIGGLVLELHRFGRARPDLVQLKVVEAAATDVELRGLERALHEQRPVRELREAGLGGACVHCGAVHGSADRFCASCGESLRPQPAPEAVDSPVIEGTPQPQ